MYYLKNNHFRHLVELSCCCKQMCLFTVFLLVCLCFPFFSAFTGLDVLFFTSPDCRGKSQIEQLNSSFWLWVLPLRTVSWELLKSACAYVLLPPTTTKLLLLFSPCRSWDKPVCVCGGVCVPAVTGDSQKAYSLVQKPGRCLTLSGKLCNSQTLQVCS